MQCLLLHGIGGSPFEMLPLADALAAAGFAAIWALQPVQPPRPPKEN